MHAPSAASHPLSSVDGILNLDKPTGWTSHDVVGWVRKTLHQRSVGHAGTLDPMATGVLLVCVGQATRIAEYLVASDKAYLAVARLGVATDTYDATGAVTATAPVPELTLPSLRAALIPFTGAIQQVPPAYSAIKQGGEAAYRKARRGERVALPPRPVTIHSIEIVSWQQPELTFEVVCSAGTYIRSLVHDLGQALGCGAHLAALTRLRSGGFRLDQATTLAELSAAVGMDRLADHLYPVEAALARLVRVPVASEDVARLRHGQPISCPETPFGDAGYAASADGRVIAILSYRDGQWWPHKVFQHDDDHN